MVDLDKFFSKFRLEKKRTTKATVITLIIAVVLAAGALTALQFSIAALNRRTEDLRQQAAHLEAENAELQEDIDQVGSIKSIVEIAEEQLDLVQPDAVFFQTEP